MQELCASAHGFADSFSGDITGIRGQQFRRVELCQTCQQLAALIRSGELEVQGDIQVVQNFVALADLAEFDPAELLAPYTGDIAAESIGKAVRGGAKFLRHGFQRQQRYAVEAITEEWRMAPGPLEVAWFAEETAAVERAVDSLTTRLEKLEAK